MIFEGDRCQQHETEPRSAGICERQIKKPISLKNLVSTFINTFPMRQQIFKTYLFFVYNYNNYYKQIILFIHS